MSPSRFSDLAFTSFAFPPYGSGLKKITREGVSITAAGTVPEFHEVPFLKNSPKVLFFILKKEKIFNFDIISFTNI